MKKMRNYLKAITLLIVTALVMVTMNYCSKTNSDTVDMDNQNEQTKLIEKSKAMQEHILAFKAKMEYFRDNPELKTSELKQIDSTVMDWESTINYTYCYNYLELSDAITYDTIIEIPVIEGDSITMANVSSKYYNDIIVAVQNHYFEAPYNNKKLMSVDLKSINDGNSLWISSVIGNTQVISMPPYDWYYGKYDGTCLNHLHQFTYDAAVILAQNTRSHFSEDPPSGNSWFFVNIETIEITNPLEQDENGEYIYDNPYDYDIDNYEDYLIYFANDDIEVGLDESVLCLEYSCDLQFYKQSYIDLTQGWIDDSNGKKFKICTYTGLEFFDVSSKVKHELVTKIGKRYLSMAIEKGDISTY